LSELGIRNYVSVFLDLNLPDVHGFDVLRQIKQMAPETKVIVITADDSAMNKKQAYEEGAFYFFGKPFGTTEIKEIMKTCLTTQQYRNGAII